MKVTLINPKSFGFLDQTLGGQWLPLGLMAIAGVTEKVADILVIDQNVDELTNDHLVEKVRGSDVVGLTCQFDTFFETQALAKLIKENLPEITVVLGGPFITAAPDFALLNTQADIACLGESEVTFTELLSALESKSDIAGIEGIAFTDKEGKTIFTRRRKQIKCLDDYTPAYDTFAKYLNIYKMGGDIEKKKSLPFITSRGCMHSCSFCNSDYLGALRFLSIDEVRRRLTKLLDIVPDLQNIHIQDADFAPFSFQDRTIELVKCVGEFDVSFDTLMHAETVTEELLTVMKENGGRQIFLGVESLSPGVLRQAKKFHRPGRENEMILNAVDLVQQSGMTLVVFLLFGLPGDTMEKMKETVEFAKSTGAFIISNLTTPIPGTPLFKYAVDHGYTNPSINFIDKLVTWIRDELANKDRVYGRPTGINFSDVDFDYIAQTMLEIKEHNFSVTDA